MRHCCRQPRRKPQKPHSKRHFRQQPERPSERRFPKLPKPLQAERVNNTANSVIACPRPQNAATAFMA
ncbi:hypothetical protein NEIELOOT_00260 [Neisseria elongata subsp. glycolytica ATCC 29315]|uniref:Uncharacterized protein n=1 Tax=Neisseria elongata subsp. glycolytica ATCC 29315 TaxID=546263 RepID=D4DMJ2_NEIEG|nr:hypothetical protein NEIELOOT_00260 [Neisseria elongata subsp. glycolytica ATCC 29315]